MRIHWKILAVAAFGWMAPHALADTLINVGALSYDTFIPAGGGSPGVDAFDIVDLTGSFDLPPDFPVSDSLTFMNAILTLTLSDSSQEVFDLGDVGPGFLMDGNGNPVVQVSGDQVFTSAEFTATLSATLFMLDDGSSFQADTPAMDILLLPSSGPTLTVDVDQTPLTVSGAPASSVTEPATGLPALLWIVVCVVSVRVRARCIL